MGLFAIKRCSMSRDCTYDGVYYNPVSGTFVQVGRGWVSDASLRAKWQAANAEILHQALAHSNLSVGSSKAKRARTATSAPVARLQQLNVRASWAFVQSLPATTE